MSTAPVWQVKMFSGASDRFLGACARTVAPSSCLIIKSLSQHNMLCTLMYFEVFCDFVGWDRWRDDRKAGGEWGWVDMLHIGHGHCGGEDRLYMGCALYPLSCLGPLLSTFWAECPAYNTTCNSHAQGTQTKPQWLHIPNKEVEGFLFFSTL